MSDTLDFLEETKTKIRKVQSLRRLVNCCDVLIDNELELEHLAEVDVLYRVKMNILDEIKSLTTEIRTLLPNFGDEDGGS